MTVSSSMKFLRVLIIPIATLAGAIATPALIMPSAGQIRSVGGLVDGTGYGSAAVLGLFLGALVGYIIRTILDHSIWLPAKNDDHNRPA
jgi:H+/gluconate symporter-like permease